jgi:hypothetical protein
VIIIRSAECRLKDRIAQLCEQYGLKFVETEESYTSKASFVDLDLLPKFGEKPEGWTSSGKRIKRGLYRSNQGWLINADANGAANIGRKVAIMLGLDLSGISFRHFVNAFESPFMDLVKNPPHSCVGSVKDRIIQTKLKTKSEESNEFTRKFGNY